MTWTVTISGSSEDKKEEAKALKHLAQAVKEADATSAMGTTQHHGPVDLLDPDASWSDY